MLVLTDVYIVAHSLKARILESQQPAVTRQWPINRGMAFSVYANGWACNSGIHHAITRPKLHCNRGSVFCTICAGLYNELSGVLRSLVSKRAAVISW
jgi:hypothetical protein